MLESELSKKLRAFIISMDDTYGDGMTLELAETHRHELYTALNRYSHGMFEKYSEDDILAELIIDELLCDDQDNELVKETKRLTCLKTSAERVFKEVHKDQYYRDVLVKSFIKRATIPFDKKIENVKNPRVFDMIQKISTYQLSKKEEKRKNGKVKGKNMPFEKLRPWS